MNGSVSDGIVERPDVLTRLGRFVALSALVALGLWLVYKIRVVLLILAAGLAITQGLDPLVRALSRNRPPLRPLAIGLAYLIIVVGLATAGVLGLRPAADDARTLAATLPDTIQRVDAWLTGTTAGLRQMFPGQREPQRESGAASVLARKAESFVANLEQYAAGVAAAGESFLTLAAAGGLSIIVSVFFLSDPAYYRRQLFAVVPRAIRPDAEALLREIDLVLAAYVRGQIIIAVAVGLAATLAMALMGVKYAVFLGVFTTVTQLIPQVGGAIGLIVAVAVSALQNPALALGVAVLYLVLYELSGHILGPLVMGRAVRLHPLVILLATMVGAILGGVVGLLVSVPAAAMLKVVWNFFYPRFADRWDLESSRDPHPAAVPPDHGAD